jgi:hypothetical protein
MNTTTSPVPARSAPLTALDRAKKRGAVRASLADLSSRLGGKA